MTKKGYNHLALVWITFIQVVAWQNSLVKCCSVDLINKVVYEGDVNVLQPRKSGETVKWQIIPASQAFATIRDITSPGDTVSSGFEVAYSADSLGLLIKKAAIAPVTNTTPSHSIAGLYILSYLNSSCKTAAKLVVARNQSCSCQPNSSDPSTARLTCSIEFADTRSISKINPLMTWMKNGTEVVKTEQPSAAMLNSYTLKSNSTLTIDSASETKYSCRLSFTAPTDTRLTYAAKNAPDFKASCDIANCVLGVKKPQLP